MKNSILMNGKELTLTKFALAVALFSKATYTISDSQGIAHTGIVVSVSWEDGSKQSWLVATQGGQQFHVRTFD